MRPKQLSDILACEFNAFTKNLHTPVMIWGAPGIGKSQIVADIANKYKVKLIDIRLSQMEPSDLRGIPFKNGPWVDWSIPSLLPNEDRHGKQGVLFLDEITAAAPSIAAAAYQLILDRRLGEYELPQGWMIVAAGNRAGDRGITYTMPAPLANRFSHYELDTHLDDWVAWAYAHNIDERIIGFLRYRPELLFSFDPSQNPIAFPSPRTWEFSHRALTKFNNDEALLSQSINACVGEAASIELTTFIAHLKDLPDLDDICAGKSVSVPKEIDLQYAICAALVGRAIAKVNKPDAKKVWGAILNFATQLPQKEMAVMLALDMQRAIGEAIFEVEEFSNWSEKAADLMFD